MNRLDLISEVSNYFNIQELVGPAEYKKWGDKCWRYLRTELLWSLLVIRRDILKTPIYVNDWQIGGTFDERGFRSNISDIVKGKTYSNSLYCSAHTLGAAVDFDAVGYTAKEARRKIIEKKDILPCQIRLEDGVNWVHFDVFDDLHNNEKVILFKS